jgi:hypothetical protein
LTFARAPTIFSPSIKTRRTREVSDHVSALDRRGGKEVTVPLNNNKIRNLMNHPQEAAL